MDGRRLVDAPDDRLEVADVERPRIEVPVPSDDVERVVVENELIDAVVLLHEQTEVAHLVVRVELERAANVALGVRRPFLELAELVAVALGPPHVPAALEHEKLRLPGRLVEAIAMENAAMNDE